MKKPNIKEYLKTYIKTRRQKIYLPPYGMGDAILFTVAAEQLAKQHGSPILVAHKDANAIYKNNPFIKPLNGFYHDMNINKKIYNDIIKKKIELIYSTYLDFHINSKKQSKGDAPPSRYIYTLPQHQHLITTMCKNTGITGEIKIEPKIYLSEEEEKFGRFFSDNKIQIAVMNTQNNNNNDRAWNKWQELINRLKHKYYFVQLGANNNTTDIPLDGALDKRVLTIRQQASILYNSDLFVGQLGGLAHMARAVNTRSVIAYSTSEPATLGSYSCNENVFPDKACHECAGPDTSFWFHPCHHDFICVRTINIDKMIEAIEKQLAKSDAPLEVETVKIKNSKKESFDDYIKRNYEFFYQRNLLESIKKYVVNFYLSQPAVHIPYRFIKKILTIR